MYGKAKDVTFNKIHLFDKKTNRKRIKDNICNSKKKYTFWTGIDIFWNMNYQNIEIGCFWTFRDLHDLINKNAQGLQLHTHLGFIVEMSNNNCRQKKFCLAQNKVKPEIGVLLLDYLESSWQLYIFISDKAISHN